jgi:hypothetical protein
MSSYDEPGDTRAKQLIQDRQERLENVLDMLVERAASLELTPAHKRELAVHIVNYHRVLKRYEHEPVLDDGDIPDISPIRNRLGKTTQTVVDSPGLAGGQTYQEVPAVEELNFWQLEEIAGDLESAAKKLGFWAPAADDVAHNDVGLSDLEGLTGSRGQEQAVENLPIESEAEE